ncbi:MAG: sigma-70 family RNA polymerase sigma factor [Chlorobi bacterium]|nr:sigma-70 family RNA polymerase sigma factor [Chlorobiota bacterium]
MSKTHQQYYNFSKEELRYLLELTKDGDTNSYQELSSLIRSISYSYFKSKYNYGKLHTLDDADDLANDVFIAFAKQYQDILDIEKWLRRVLFLTFVSFYKKQRSRSFTEFDETFHEENISQDVSISLDSEKIMSIVSNLKDPKDKIIMMRFWEGMKFSEIAEKLDRKETAVKKMFYRSIEEVKNKLE